MKRIILFVFLTCLVLCTGCSGKEMPAQSDPLSPAIEQLKNETVLVRCTSKSKDLAFSVSDFCALTGEQTEYIVIGTLPRRGLLMLGGKAVIAGQTIPVSSLDYLKYVPESADAEGDADSAEVFFTFTSKAPSWENRELTCKIAVLESDNYAPVAKDLGAQTYASVICFVDLPVSDPDGDDAQCKITRYPQNGFVKLDGGTAVYLPSEDFVGEDTFCYVASDCYGNTSVERTVTVTVAQNQSGIMFADLAESPVHNAAISLCAEEVMTYRMENGAYYFDPDQTVSKIDGLIMMMCLTGKTDTVVAVTDTEAMDDGKLSAGKKGFLQAAIAGGVAHLQNGSFAPESELTAADAAYMAMRLLGIPALSAKKEFSDLQAAPAWACTALVSADSTGILESNGDALDANRVLTRAEFAQMLQKMKAYNG